MSLGNELGRGKVPGEEGGARCWDGGKRRERGAARGAARMPLFRDAVPRSAGMPHRRASAGRGGSRRSHALTRRLPRWASPPNARPTCWLASVRPPVARQKGGAECRSAAMGGGRGATRSWAAPASMLVAGLGPGPPGVCETCGGRGRRASTPGLDALACRWRSGGARGVCLFSRERIERSRTGAWEMFWCEGAFACRCVRLQVLVLVQDVQDEPRRGRACARAQLRCPQRP